MSFTKRVVTTYAKSLFQNLKENSISEQTDSYFNIGKITSLEANKIVPDIYYIGEELLLIRSVFISSKTILKFFKNPTYSEKEKLNILLSLFPGLSVSLQAFLRVLTERSHLSLLPEISQEYGKILLAFRNATKVRIVTANALKETYGLLLLNTLKTLTKSKEIILTAGFNPKLLGGIVIEYNSKSIDASILKEFSLFFNES